jgi:zinc-binding alcohol dehydrogenase/oxidoreductase
MKALVLNALHRAPDFQEVEMPAEMPGRALVRLHAAALNHRDVYITQGLYAGITMPCILGSDGAGEYLGRKVLIFPSLDWGDNPRAQGRQFRVLGMPDNGTFAEYISIPEAHVYDWPEHLTAVEAAALPLAGVTAWRTLFTRCQCIAGEKVLITGIGGGVALMALQFAIAAGAEVYVTSGSVEKLEKAVALGAKGGANYKEAGWDKQLKEMAGGFDVVIDSAGGPEFHRLLGLCQPGARIGMYGGTLGKMDGISPQLLFWKQISLLGATMGTAADFRQMLDFVVQHQLRPVVDSVWPMAKGGEAFERMAAGSQFGKITLDISGT